MTTAKCSKPSVRQLLFLSLAFLLALPGLDSSAAPRDRAAALEQQANRAGHELEGITADVLRHYVSQNKAIDPYDLEDLKTALAELNKHHVRFDKNQKAYLYLLDGLIAHYSGDQEQALQKVQKAFRTQRANVDVADTVITLALSYHKYDLARDVLKVRKSGNAVRTQLELPQESFDIARAQISHAMEPDPNAQPQASVVDPNLVKAQQQTPPGPHPEEAGLGSVTAKKTKRTGKGLFADRVKPTDPIPQTTEHSPKTKTPVRRPPRSRRPTSRFSRGRTSGPTGILNLLTDCMPGENLGKQFTSIQLRTVNGSYYRFEPGRGQMLCLFSWSLPDASAQAAAPYGRTRNSRYGQQASSQPSLDVQTNIEQFRELFEPYFLSGKIGFVAVNLDTAERISDLVKALSSGAYPWVNCMFADNVNSEQLLPFVQAQPVITIVGVDGIIRYVGPVGGYLPRMIFDTELAQAQFAMPSSSGSAMPVFTPSDNATPAPGTSNPASGGDLLGKLLGASPGQAPQTQPVQPTTGARRRAPVPSNLSGAGQSSPEAAKKLELGRVNKRFSPNSSLKYYDEILEKYPHSLEAGMAKIFIKQIVRDNPRISRQRERDKKYPFNK